MYSEKILDLVTDTISVRNYTHEEVVAAEEARTTAEAQASITAEAAAAKAALLARLGITEDEAKLLLS